MEHTPVGNVLMIYDKERETFKYYSDNTIPYRYLDVVARKYVKFFDCRPIFINTEEEIQLAEKKNEQAKKEKEEKEALDKKRREEAAANHKPVEEKKQVFAKFIQFAVYHKLQRILRRLFIILLFPLVRLHRIL